MPAGTTNLPEYQFNGNTFDGAVTSTAVRFQAGVAQARARNHQFGGGICSRPLQNTPTTRAISPANKFSRF